MSIARAIPLLLALALPLSARAEDATFDISIRGLTAARLTMTGQADARSYSAAGVLQSAGLLSLVRAIRYAADKVGVQHVALGSDFNGTVHTPFDTTGLAQITEGLQGAGFSDADIAAIMGGNVRDLLLASLPD